MRTISRLLESAFETFLFNSRLIVILAVLGSLTSSVLMFIRGAILIVHSAKDFAHHWNDAHSDDLSIALISSVDSFLFATVLLIFAMGIYELFISKIDPASRTEDSRPNWLQIHSLDDLKGAVGKVILMILIVRLFESAVKMKYDHPLHLLYLGLAVLFVAAALFLQHLGHKKPHEEAHATKHEAKKETHAKEAPKHEAPAPQMMGAFASAPPSPTPVQPFAPMIHPPQGRPLPPGHQSETMEMNPPSAFAHPPPTIDVPSSALTSLPMSLPPPQPQQPVMPSGVVPSHPNAQQQPAIPRPAPAPPPAWNGTRNW